MSDTLLSFLLARLDQLERPYFLHRELERFPLEEVGALRAEGVLREISRATEIPRIVREGSGTLQVRQTSKGLFGIAVNDDDYFDPVPLREDDVRRYEVSLAKLVMRIRLDNGISGIGLESHNGLIPLGQKVVDGFGAANLYLSLPNNDEDSLLARCRRIEVRSSARLTVLLIPRGASLSPEVHRILDDMGVLLLPLTDAARRRSLRLDWNALIDRKDIGVAHSYSTDEQVFQRRGVTWLLVYQGIPRNVNHSIGMEYICRLLQSPNRELHAAALRSSVVGAGSAPQLGSAGELLDEEALGAYRERLRDIEEESCTMPKLIATSVA